jgi:hypothetical protein
VQRESDKHETHAPEKDEPAVDKASDDDEQPTLTLDQDHRDHLGVDHRQGPVDPPESTDHLTGYDEPEAPVNPPDSDEPQQGVDNATRDGVQVPVNADDVEARAEADEADDR